VQWAAQHRQHQGVSVGLQEWEGAGCLGGFGQVGT